MSTTTKATTKATKARAGKVVKAASVTPETMALVKAALKADAGAHTAKADAIGALFREGVQKLDDIVATMRRINGGKPGLGKSTVARYRAAAAALASVEGPKATPTQARDAMRLLSTAANYGATTGDLQAIAEVAAKATTGAAMVASIRAAATDAAKQDNATVSRTRKPGGITAQTEAPKATGDEGDAPEQGDHVVGKREALGKLGLSDLVAEVVRRVSVKGFTVTTADLDAFTAITEAVEAAVAAERVVTLK